MRLLLFLAAVVATTACAHRTVTPAPPAPAPAAAAANAANPPDPDAVKMPEAPGKADVVQVCGGCHTLARVVRLRQTRKQWQATITEMKGNGMFASPAELARILDYLSQNYGPAPSAGGGVSRQPE